VERLLSDGCVPTGKLSAVMAERYFGVTDGAALDAMRCHTTLRAGASLVDRLLFVADKLSWDAADATFRPRVAAALSRSLDDGVRASLSWA
jgi:HD superfamily phosphohydrolase YqeK